MDVLAELAEQVISYLPIIPTYLHTLTYQV